jgi:histidinol phosphatase-like enzyme (inositol monophosphatase family)
MFPEIPSAPSSIFRVFVPIRGFKDEVNLEPHRAFMVELAGLSGDFIRPYFGQSGVKVELKADQSPVTAADRGAEELMRGAIRARFPSHGIIGEELGSDRADAEFVWVLDPIDGTQSFLSAVPLFGTLIALLHDGQPVLGCIHQPILGQMLVGDNRSASLNGRPVHTRSVRKIEDATLLTSDPVAIANDPGARGYSSLMRRAKLARMWGDCYGYLLVATGWADVMYDPLMNPWDIAALVPVIRGAGGVITDSKGAAPYPAHSIVAAANETLHREVIAGLSS